MMTLNLALLSVLQLSPLQFFFRDRQNFLHCLFEFIRRLLLGRSGHDRTISPNVRRIQRLERRAYKTDVPIATMLRSARTNLPQSIV